MSLLFGKGQSRPSTQGKQKSCSTGPAPGYVSARRIRMGETVNHFRYHSRTTILNARL